jgi:cytochrome c553
MTMSIDAADSPRFCLRDLPIPAKVVITCFLISVGLGYTAALVQLHFQDSKSGDAMPTVSDVVLKFTGKKWFTEPPPPPVSKFVKLITAPEEGPPFNGSGTMSPAFFSKDADFGKIGRADESKRPQLRAEHEGERDALVLWANLSPKDREDAFTRDHFDVKDKMPKTITKTFAIDGAVKVKSIIEARCVHCHMKDGDNSSAEQYPLTTYVQISKYLDVPLSTPFKAGGDWVKVEEPIGLEKLTQSTHAHLLSFAVLFTLTGLVFAFTSYPAIVRCVLGPWVLLAIVTDVAFWWLARLSHGYGVYFAMGVLGTGGAAGLGLAAQITLSLWNMYGAKGKFVLFLLFALGGAAAALVGWKVVWPGLEKKQAEIAAVGNHQPSVTPNDHGPPVVTPKEKKDPLPPVVKPLSKAAQLLTFPIKGPDGKEIAYGTDVPWSELKFKKEQPGSMVRAFFDKDKAEFAAALKEKDLDSQKRLMPERHGERQALLAWIKLAETERKKAYDADSFDLPAELSGKPVTKDYLKDGKVRIKALVTDRCITCHADEEKAPFDGYDAFRKYLEPMLVGKP